MSLAPRTYRLRDKIMNENIEEEIKSIVNNFIAKNGHQVGKFSDTDDLLRNRALDSLDVINIVCEIQDTLGLNVNIDNPSTIINKKWFCNLLQ